MQRWAPGATGARSNRTFMELKYGGEVVTKRDPHVLIVPLWN